MIATLTSQLITWIAHHGAYAVFALMALDALLPVGGELIMLYAGALGAGAISAEHATLFGTQLATGTESYVILALAGTLGYLLGSVVYIPLLCALALAAGAPAIARSSPPRLGSAMVVPVALGAALAADAALMILVGARLIDAAPLAAVLGWRAEASGPHPVPLPVSVAAAVGLIVVVVVGHADWRRSSLATRRWRALRGHGETGELVVVRSSAMLALTLPATRTSPGRILVSDGMLRTLDAAERRVFLLTNARTCATATTAIGGWSASRRTSTRCCDPRSARSTICLNGGPTRTPPVKSAADT